VKPHPGETASRGTRTCIDRGRLIAAASALGASMPVLDAHTNIDEATLIARLRSDDEALVKELIDERSPAMLRLAGTYLADAPTVDPIRFREPDDDRPGATSSGSSRPWDKRIDLDGRHQIVDVVDLALDLLPGPQRTVVLLRDVQGLSADETCSTLRLSTEHQRVLLHSGRAALGAVLEDYTS
jgi:DNA-directed RNA polymerase specialized sigma24 family protein